MASNFFALLKITLQQALTEKMHWYCCNNAVSLLNEAKTLTFRPVANFKGFRLPAYCKTY